MKLGTDKMIPHAHRLSHLVLIFLILSVIQSTKGLKCYQCEDTADTACKDLLNSVQSTECPDDTYIGCSITTTLGEDLNIGKVKRECSLIGWNKCTKERIHGKDLYNCNCNGTRSGKSGGDDCNGKQKKANDCYQCTGDLGSSCNSLKDVRPESCIIPYFDICIKYKYTSGKGMINLTRSCAPSSLYKDEDLNKCETKDVGDGVKKETCVCAGKNCNDDSVDSGGEKRWSDSALFGAVLGLFLFTFFNARVSIILRA